LLIRLRPGSGPGGWKRVFKERTPQGGRELSRRGRNSPGCRESRVPERGGSVIPGADQGKPEGGFIGIEPDKPAGKETGQGLDEPAFITAGERGKEAPGSGVFQFPQNSRGGVAQNRVSPVLPKVRQTAAVFGVKPEIPGAAYNRQRTEERRFKGFPVQGAGFPE
jgi:hypothetical protein